MQGDATRTTLAIENTLHHYIQDTTHAKILAWPTKTDPTRNHATACERRQTGTGEWFLESHEYSYPNVRYGFMGFQAQEKPSYVPQSLKMSKLGVPLTISAYIFISISMILLSKLSKTCFILS